MQKIKAKKNEYLFHASEDSLPLKRNTFSHHYFLVAFEVSVNAVVNYKRASRFIYMYGRGGAALIVK